MAQKLAVLTRRVESRILVLRGRRVIFDSDLAELYGVKVKRLNEQVKRNAERFPQDFVFSVTVEDLRSQIATSKLTAKSSGKTKISRRGGRRYHTYAFSEHGAIMVATVLNSK
jgi:ORF6N domain